MWQKKESKLELVASMVRQVMPEFEVIYDLAPAPTSRKGRSPKHGRRLSIYEEFVLSAEKMDNGIQVELKLN